MFISASTLVAIRFSQLLRITHLLVLHAASSLRRLPPNVFRLRHIIVKHDPNFYYAVPEPILLTSVEFQSNEFYGVGFVFRLITLIN